ncbi:gfo/Idh/MocA family oxidoreductase, partial [Streptomyces sp. NPDC007070]
LLHGLQQRGLGLGLPSPHGDQLLDFCDAVAEGRPPAVDGEEGRRALLTVLAVYEAARTGAVTRVPSAPALDPSPAPSAPMTPEPA